jgi:5'-nucleotidase (lipoprotein e(P4) family)
MKCHHSLQTLPLAVLLAASLVLTSCKSTSVPAFSRENPVGDKNTSSDRGIAVLWFQRAAEARALYFQAYNIARERLDAALAWRQGEEKLAVIMDIDETVLDNSPLEADLIKTGKTFSEKSWKEWVSQCQARALPGAQPFLAYAASNKVEVFYVSNRNSNDFDDTARNLRAQHFPMVDAEHLLLQQAHEGKEPRRQEIGRKYKIVLLMGDNLGDFTDIFDKQTSEVRSGLADENRDKFGSLFIVLPNPMYGTWEDCLYPPGIQTDQQKSDLRWELLKSWR